VYLLQGRLLTCNCCVSARLCVPIPDSEDRIGLSLPVQSNVNFDECKYGQRETYVTLFAYGFEDMPIGKDRRLHRFVCLPSAYVADQLEHLDVINMQHNARFPDCNLVHMDSLADPETPYLPITLWTTQKVKSACPTHYLKVFVVQVCHITLQTVMHV
jgi:hypothetical protein